MLEKNAEYLIYQPKDSIYWLISVAVCAICIIIAAIMCYQDRRRKTILVYAILIVVLLGISTWGNVNYYQRLQKKQQYGEKRVEYTVYLNGQEVDLDHIDIRKYDMSIDDKAEKIYLSGA